MIKRLTILNKMGEHMTKYLALHETLDVHELITFKNLCLTKAVTMSAFVQDEELKAIMENDVTTGTEHIKRLQQHLTKREEESS
jgi:similar to spore coat protein